MYRRSRLTVCVFSLLALFCLADRAAAQIYGGVGQCGAPSPNMLAIWGSGCILGVAPQNNAVLGTNGSGIPSFSTTLPSGLTLPSPTFTGTTTMSAITSSVGGSGTYPGAGPWIFAIGESYTPGAGNFVDPFVVQDTLLNGGNGNRNSFVSNMIVNNGAAGGFYTGGNATGDLISGGGHIYGFGTVVTVEAAIANGNAGGVSLEADTQILNGTVYDKIGFLAGDVCSGAGVRCSTGTGTVRDAAFMASTQAGTVGYQHGFAVGSTLAGDIGVKATGDIVYASAHTYARGVHLSDATFTITPFDSTGFSVDPIGNITGQAWYGANNSMGVYPTTGTTSWAITDNFTSGAGEVDFWNRQTTNIRGFNFYQMSGTNAATLIASLDGAGNLNVAGEYINQQFLISTSTLTKTSDAALATVPGLSQALTAGKTYSCRGHLTGVSGASGGIKVALVASGGLTATSTTWTGLTYAGVGLLTSITVTALGGANPVAATTQVYSDLYIDGSITVGVAGTINVQAAQNTSNGTATTVLQGSTFSCTRVN
jgi:hypothetical protein